MPEPSFPPLASLVAEDRNRSSRSYSISAGAAFPESDYSPTPARPSSPPPDPFDLTDEEDHPSTSPSTPTATSFPSSTQEEASGTRTPVRRGLEDEERSAGQRSRTPSPSRASRSRPLSLSGPSSRDRSPVGSSSRTGSPLKKAFGVETRDRVVSLPQLTASILFLAISPNDPLQVPLTKYITQAQRPPRDLTGSYDGLELPQLLAMNSWRALANLARDTIRTCNPEDSELIFEMFTLRHVALVSLHLPVHHTRELHLLFSAIAHLPSPIRNIIHSRNLIPFSLELMLAKSRGGVDELASLLKRCKLAARKAGKEKVEESQLWKERGMRVGVVIAGVLVDSGDPVAALSLLSPLSSSPTTPPYVLSSIQRLLLSIGNLPAAALILERILAHPSSTDTEKGMAQGFAFVAQGDNKNAQLAFGRIAEEREGHGDGLVAANASSVAALYMNELDRAISIIESAIRTSPSSTLIEPIIFNLATLYELRMGQEACVEKKVELLVKVAEWGGDGVRPACLKLS